AVSWSLLFVEASKDVRTPCAQRRDTQGASVRSVPLVRTPSPTPAVAPNEAWSAALCRRRRLSWAVRFWRRPPTQRRGGAKAQLTLPDGHSVLRMRRGTYSVPRGTSANPRV